MNLFTKCRTFYFAISFLLICMSCNQKTSPAEKTKDMVFIVNLVNDEQKLKEYLAYHEKVWPEVEAGFRKAGYKKISIYRFNKSLVMIVTVPQNADMNQMGKIAEGYDKKCKEWNELMNNYQIGVAGTAEGQKWALAEPMYLFENN